MKSPKPIVAGALVAGGLLFTSAAAALTLPDEASDTAKEQVGALIAGESEDAKSAADDRRQDDTDETSAETEEVEETTVEESQVEETDGGERPETHGSEVSALATSDETKALDGRERGEEISNLARTNGGAEVDDEAKAEEDVEDDTDDDTDDDEDADDTEGGAGAARAAQARQGK